MKSILACVVLTMAAGLASAQNFNPPPCDFSDLFYQQNGIDQTKLVLRFGDNGGTTRLTGPPATGSQVNFVADPNCSATDPTRRNFRILATTGGNADDGNSPFTNSTPETLEFISILAFLTNQSNFETTYSQKVESNTISIVNGANPRGIHMQDIVGFFEAYASVKQTTPSGFALNPCQADMQAPGFPTSPCFDLGTVNAVFTPNLRQDWRFATNRNAMDGSDGNCITSNDQTCKRKGSFSDSPFGYFCDDLLGMWIITYFWFTDLPAPNTVNPTCAKVYHDIGTKNGFNLDGTPIILTAHELNDELEANNCGAEGQEDPAGGDGGAVWLICPAIPDPRNGAIASDAFLDAVHNSDGSFQDQRLAQNFTCLQQTGQFCP
jgi:hypothetical protein